MITENNSIKNIDLMNTAERKRKSREKLKKSGAAEFSITLSGENIELIQFLAEAWCIPRSRVIHKLLNEQIKRKISIMKALVQLSNNGADQEELDNFFRTHVYPPVPAISTEKESF